MFLVASTSEMFIPTVLPFETSKWIGKSVVDKPASRWKINDDLNSRVSVYQGDMAELEVDAIVISTDNTWAKLNSEIVTDYCNKVA